MSPFKRFRLTALFALLSIISFIQIWQYVAERTGTGLWIGLGILFLGLALIELRKVIKDADNGKSQQ